MTGNEDEARDTLTLEHIVWNIQDPEKIGNFLQKLTFNDSETCLDVSRGMKDIINDAMEHLVKWKQQQLDENPIVLLSHALDKTALPFELMGNIIEFEVEGFVDRLTRRHIETMAPFLDIGKIRKTIHVINEENKESMFNTKAMLTEWIGQVECSNYEKRWRLNKAITRIGRQDLTGHTMKRDTLNLSDFVEDELQRITTYLSSSQMKELFGIVDDDPQNELRAYVERLVPLTLESKVYLCELLDVAFRLLLDDVYPLAEALGISGERLKKYRVDYTPDHLNEGTTAALMKFSKTHNNDRKELCEALSKAGYRDIAQVLEYGHETSFADEFAVASRARVDEDVLVKISRNLGMSHTNNTETVLRDWKTMVHPPSYNQRTCLADAVFPVLGAKVADDILSGESGKTEADIVRAYKSAIPPMITQILGVTVAKSCSAQESYIKTVLETWEEKIRKKPLSKDERRELSDYLLRAGFNQFAFEIMTGQLFRKT
eukprot:XP_011671348.1 PREDICTED: uncharacterized protein LOC105441678 [Strongylocentrotus purpuratus]